MKLSILILLSLSLSLFKVNAAVKAISPKTDTMQFAPIHIRLYFDRATSRDTLELRFYPNILSRNPASGIDSFRQVTSVMNHDGSYDFNFTPFERKCGYVGIENKFSKSNNADHQFSLLPLPLVNAGDDVTIKIHFRQKHPGTPLISPLNMDYTFSGPSARQYYIISHLDSIPTPYRVTGTDSDYYEFGADEQRYIDNKLNYLSKYRSALPDNIYQQLKADVCYGGDRYARYVVLADTYKRIPETDSTQLARFKRGYFNVSRKDEYSLAPYVLFHSYYYGLSELVKLRTDDLVANGHFDCRRLYHYISESFKGKVRDKLIAALLFRYGRNVSYFNELLDSALHVVKNPYCLHILNKLKSRATGTLAYNFQLPDFNGKMVRLSDFRGKLVFIDFWYTGCESCAGYYQNELSKAEKYLENDTSVVFMTISIDKSLNGWRNSVKSNEYTSPDVINLFTEGKGADSAVIKKYGISGYPNPLLIDRNGHIIRFGDAGLRNNDHTGKGLINTINTAKKM